MRLKINKLYNYVLQRKNDFSFIGLFLYFLTALSIIYGKIVELNIKHIKRLNKKTFQAKLISLGNITVGGTGKTPLAGWLAAYLASKGEKVGIVLRGYARAKNSKNPLLLEQDYLQEEHKVKYFGDEALLLHELAPHASIVVCADRIKAIKRLNDECKCSIILLDDGFQQVQVSKYMDIVCLDPQRPLGNGYLLPRGNLREFPEALNRGTHFVFCKGHPRKRARSKVMAELEDESQVVYACDYRIIGAYDLRDPLKIIELDELKGKKVLILSAIGNPESFKNSLQALDIYGTARSFPDHFQFKQDNIDEINDFISKHKLEIIVTTEKDAMRMKDIIFDIPCYVLEGEITPPDEFIKEVDKLLV